MANGRQQRNIKAKVLLLANLLLRSRWPLRGGDTRALSCVMSKGMLKEKSPFKKMVHGLLNGSPQGLDPGPPWRLFCLVVPVALSCVTQRCLDPFVSS